MTRTVQCIKLGQEAEGLPAPPLPGPLGKRIFDNVSKQAWGEWLRHQTMIINENHLSLGNAEHRKLLAQEMEKHFFGEGSEKPAGYVPPAGN